MLCTNSKVPFDKSEFSKISSWVFIACLDDIKKAWLQVLILTFAL